MNCLLFRLTAIPYQRVLAIGITTNNDKLIVLRRGVKRHPALKQVHRHPIATADFTPGGLAAVMRFPRIF
jgi:hypothetical protein